MIIRVLRFILLLIGLVSPLLAECNDEQNKLDISDRIRKEIVVGIPAAEVRSIFEKYKIEYSYVPIKLLVFSMPPLPESAKTEMNGRFVAILRDVKINSLVTTSNSFEIDIDKNDIVSRVNIAPVYTGP